MPPFLNLVLRSSAPVDFSAVKEQWQNPNDVLTILMIIGGDIIQSALAQLVSSSPRPFTPIAFSFGWVAYSFSAILSAVGSHRLAPEPDCDCTLTGIETGYQRDVKSWNLARLVRDHETLGGDQRGLTITFFDTISDKETGVPDRDWVYYTGVLVIIVQLGIAAIPGALHNNWLILILTFGGIILAQVQAALPQWKKELWEARKIGKDKHEVVCLTTGNGSSYVIVIRSNGCGLRLSDIAGARKVLVSTTVPATFILAILWLVHLFTMQSVENDPWYSLAIGAIGMLQNIIAAGARRSPAALGFHLKKVHEIHDKKVFEAIKKAEKFQKKSGPVLADVFFPGGLRPDEEQWKQETIQSNKEDTTLNKQAVSKAENGIPKEKMVAVQ